MSDDKIRRWEDKERAAYFAHQKFYDFDGREISRDEAMRLACSENGFIRTNAPHLVAVDRSVIEEAVRVLSYLEDDVAYRSIGSSLVRVRDALKGALGR